jgi:hypothetical protein
MFGKLSRHHFNSIYNNTKKHIGNVYTHTKHVLGHIDNGINMGRTVFSVLQPYIEQLGQNNINKNTMKALSYYDDIKKRVVDTHDKAENALQDIGDKLKRKNIMF